MTHWREKERHTLQISTDERELVTVFRRYKGNFEREVRCLRAELAFLKDCVARVLPEMEQAAHTLARAAKGKHAPESARKNAELLLRLCNSITTHQDRPVRYDFLPDGEGIRKTSNVTEKAWLTDSMLHKVWARYVHALTLIKEDPELKEADATS